MNTPRGEGLEKRLYGADPRVQGCARGDKAFYNVDEQVCELLSPYTCPFQARNTVEIIENGVIRFPPLCNQHRPTYDMNDKTPPAKP